MQYQNLVKFTITEFFHTYDVFLLKLILYFRLSYQHLFSSLTPVVFSCVFLGRGLAGFHLKLFKKLQNEHNSLPTDYIRCLEVQDNMKANVLF